ncbi:hypothetical protein FKM82_005140 [Ascaphus truei]
MLRFTWNVPIFAKVESHRCNARQSLPAVQGLIARTTYAARSGGTYGTRVTVPLGFLDTSWRNVRDTGHCTTRILGYFLAERPGHGALYH